jgi:hypothetical protein
MDLSNNRRNAIDWAAESAQVRELLRLHRNEMAAYMF